MSTSTSSSSFTRGVGNKRPSNRVRVRLTACCLAVASCFVSSSPRAQPADLSALGAALDLEPRSLSVSGLSSGAFMAQQFHVAYSQWVIGAGIVAGGPSGCAQHQAHGTPAVVGPITNSIAWGVDYCTSFAAKSAQAYGIDWLTNLVGSNYYLISDNPFSITGKCPTTRYSLRVPLDELDDETSLFDPRMASLPACPEPTCTSEGGRKVKYRNNPHDFACLLAHATRYDPKHAYLSDAMKQSHIFIVRGSHDAMLPLRISDALYSYYQLIGVPAENIQYVRNPPVRHTIMVDDGANRLKTIAAGSETALLRERINRCNETVDSDRDPYIDDCSCSTLSGIANSVCANSAPAAFCMWDREFATQNCSIPNEISGLSEASFPDIAGLILTNIYSGNVLCTTGACAKPWQQRQALVASSRPPASLRDVLTSLESQVIPFDQRPFLSDAEFEMSSLSDSGFIYIPEQCKTTQCRLHVSFHGCMQGRVTTSTPEKSGIIYPVYAGYNEWAKANDVVVLYPQVKTSYIPVNAFGCWDLWGYSNPLNPDYNYRDGKQMRAVARMVNALLRQEMLPIGDEH